MKREINPEEYKLFVVGETYQTKMATAERFTIHKIDIMMGQVTKFWGVYEKNPDLLNCPISPERLILNK